MKIKDLKKELPYKWRVQSFSQYKPQASCVAYIDARDVMNLLDEVVGAENWQDDYKEVKGNVYAGIGIKIGDSWSWKWDCGTESNTEKEKGEASDAFKRAGVKWGIGRFLYSLKIRYVGASEAKNKTNRPYPIDNSGQRIWDLTKHFNEIPEHARGISPKMGPAWGSKLNQRLEMVGVTAEQLEKGMKKKIVDFTVRDAKTALEGLKDEERIKKLKDIPF